MAQVGQETLDVVVQEQQRGRAAGRLGATLGGGASMVSPASVSARPRPALRSSGTPACSSSFFNCALTADVERPRRSAARPKLPSSTPATKLRNTSRSKVTGLIIPFFKTFN